MYGSVHFPVRISEMKKRIECGYTYDIDFQTVQLICKEPQKDTFQENEQQMDVQDDVNFKTGQGTCKEPQTPAASKDTLQGNELEEAHIKSVLTEVIKVMEEAGRKEDFFSVLQKVADGKLHPSNLSLQLMLDMGKFLSVNDAHSVRYNQLTKDFWSMVKTLFHGKATNIFRGYMAEGNQNGK